MTRSGGHDRVRGRLAGGRRNGSGLGRSAEQLLWQAAALHLCGGSVGHQEEQRRRHYPEPGEGIHILRQAMAGDLEERRRCRQAQQPLIS